MDSYQSIGLKPNIFLFPIPSHEWDGKGYSIFSLFGGKGNSVFQIALFQGCILYRWFQPSEKEHWAVSIAVGFTGCVKMTNPSIYAGDNEGSKESGL